MNCGTIPNDLKYTYLEFQTEGKKEQSRINLKMHIQVCHLQTAVKKRRKILETAREKHIHRFRGLEKEHL